MAIIGRTLPAQELVAVVDTEFRHRIESMNSPLVNDCNDEALPTSVEDRSKKLGKEEYFYQESYSCTLPTFIWRALNSHGCSALPAPRNWCMLDRYGTMQVNLIANKKWIRYGVDVERGRVAFAFNLEVFRDKNRYTLGIGVWEKKNEPVEWEIGPLFSLGKFNIACGEVKGKTHPLFDLLRRVVHVMTGKQYRKLNCWIYI
jgi:hypothetical protein